MPNSDQQSGRSESKFRFLFELGPVTIGLFTLTSLFAGNVIVDWLTEKLLRGILPATAHLITVVFCSCAAGMLAGLAVHRGKKLRDEASQASAERERLQAELRHILSSVRCLLWHATVEEINGEYIWETRVSDVEAAQRILPVAVPLGRTYADTWYESKLPEDSARSDESSINAFKTGAPGYSNEYRCRLATGEIRWFFEDVLVEQRGPTSFYVIGACVDVTALKAVEAKLEEERTLLRTVMDSLPDSVYLKNLKSEFLLNNAAHQQHLGAANQEELLYKTDFDVFPREYAQAYFDDEQAVIKGGGPIQNRVEPGQDRDGNPSWFWTTKVPLRDVRGKIIGVVGVSRDITQRKREEEELKLALQAVEEARSIAEHHATLLERQTKELEKARDAALGSARAKSEFLANMSHEIRTPMNGILGITELMIGTHLTDEQYELACTVRGSANALLTVINDILDFSRIEAGKVHIETMDFNLRTITEEVTDLVAGSAYRKNLELACFFAKEVPERLQGDPARIRQVLTNLMGNAVKFTETGEVTLETRLIDKTEKLATVRLSVIDTGIGVSKEAQERIFESFTQADGSTTRRYGGTGLGLTICRQLTELMGGRIGIESEEAHGSTFFVELMLPMQLGPEEPSRQRHPERLSGLRVLVVDDNATNRRVLREQLSSWGCEPSEAISCLEGLAMLEEGIRRQKPFAVAILDMQMPDIDGEQMGGRIRDDDRFDDMPLILYTSIGEHGTASEMRAKGFSVVLTKPARQSQLFNAMLAVLGEGPMENVRDAVSNDSRESLHLRVLLAEDNEINQMVAMMMLERFGCKVEAVETGLKAMECVLRSKYDVVLMDVHMPQMDGYGATAAIRSHEADGTHRTPIIAMTAKAMPGDRELCIAAGMDDYIVKPVRPDDLYEVLSRWGAKRTTEA